MKLNPSPSWLIHILACYGRGQEWLLMQRRLCVIIYCVWFLAVLFIVIVWRIYAGRGCDSFIGSSRCAGARLDNPGTREQQHALLLVKSTQKELLIGIVLLDGFDSLDLMIHHHLQIVKLYLAWTYIKIWREKATQGMEIFKTEIIWQETQACWMAEWCRPRPSDWPTPVWHPGRRSKPVQNVTTVAHLHHSLPVRSSFYCHAIYHLVYRLTIPWSSLTSLPRPAHHNDFLIKSPTHQEIQLVRKWAIIRKNTSVSFLWDGVWNAVEAFIAFLKWEIGKQDHH